MANVFNVNLDIIYMIIKDQKYAKKFLNNTIANKFKNIMKNSIIHLKLIIQLLKRKMYSALLVIAMNN